MSQQYRGNRVRTVLALDTFQKVEVFNRTSVPLEVRCDGRVFVLQPGLGSLPSVAVPYALRQHPRRGTFARGSVSGESLIGVVGVTPAAQMTVLEPKKEHKGAELIDRESFPDTSAPAGHRLHTEMLPPKQSLVSMGELTRDQRAIENTQVSNDNPPMPAPTMAQVNEFVGG